MKATTIIVAVALIVAVAAAAGHMEQSSQTATSFGSKPNLSDLLNNVDLGYFAKFIDYNVWFDEDGNFAPKLHAKTLMEEFANVESPKFTLKNITQLLCGEGTASAVENFKQQVLQAGPIADGPNQLGPFQWFPQPDGPLIPGKNSSIVVTKCFASLEYVASPMDADGNVNVTVTATGQSNPDCPVYNLLAGYPALKLIAITKPGVTTYTLKSETAAERYVTNNIGIDILRFSSSIVNDVINIIDTAQVFCAMMETDRPIPNKKAIDYARNFFDQYTQIKPGFPDRNVSTPWLPVDESLFQSGDGISVSHLDGVDQLIGFGEGTTLGHSTIIMRNETTNELHICESTDYERFWPRNGIQCHQWDTWKKLAIQDGYMVNWQPLSPKYRKLFNASKAWQFFRDNAAVNYGYHTFLFGWIDTAFDNYPCMPGDYKTRCLFWPTVRVFAQVLELFAADHRAEFFNQALSHRVNLTDRPLAEIWEAGDKAGLRQPDIMAIVERDSWRYNTTRNGKQTEGRDMVCSTFVCNMWKAGGVFSEINDEIECGEQGTWDVWSFKIFNDNLLGDNRPEVCKQADPDNHVCQLAGQQQLHMKLGFNSRPLHQRMGERCQGTPPLYNRGPDC